MKYVYSLCFCLIALLPVLHAQNYEPLVKEGATWQIWFFDSEFGYSPYGYRIGGDTIVDGINYNKLYLLDLYVSDFWDHDIEHFQLEGDTLAAFIREDLAEKKVYIRDLGVDPYYRTTICDEPTEQILFNFDLALGDTLAACRATPVPVVVDSVYVENIYGKPRRTFRLDADMGVGYGYLTEGIGFQQAFQYLYGPFNVTLDWGIELRNYCAPDIADNCELLTNAREEQNRLPVQVFPIPAREALYIEGTLPTAGQMRLYNAQGQEVLNRTVPAGEQLQTVDVSALPAGYYLLHLQCGEALFSEKLVKARR